MSRRFRIRLSLLSILVLLILSGLINLAIYEERQLNNTSDNIKTIIEQSWRSQARRTLSDLRDQFNYSVQEGKLDPGNKGDLESWSKNNLSGITNGGRTSNAFMVELGTDGVLWSSPKDYNKDSVVNLNDFMSNQSKVKDLLKKNNILYPPVIDSTYLNGLKLSNVNIFKQMYKDGLIDVDYTGISQIISSMNLGYDTSSGDNYSWNIYGGREWLEWIVIPSGKLGFDHESYTVDGKLNKKYSKILIKLGTLEQEAIKPFGSELRQINREQILLKIIISVVCVCSFLLVFGLFINAEYNNRY